MNKITVKTPSNKAGELSFEKEAGTFVFNYGETAAPISLNMPVKRSSYLWKNRLHPVFDKHMPEGYLFELLKNYISKEYGYLDDFLMFSILSPNIKSRLIFDSWIKHRVFAVYNIDEVLENDSKDTFTKLVETYLLKNAVSGVQPKSMALLKNKESLTESEYIIKTWGEEYPQLALNEYFCLKAVEYAGIKTANVRVSKNFNFLLVERFDYNKKDGIYLGFEELLGLMGKNREEKYSGSYEQLVKTVYNVVSDKLSAMKNLYKLIVMNYLLKNGDAHLKNFGIIYEEGFKNISLSPAYDIVNTVVYVIKDRPALTMYGKKLWFGKKELIKFGLESCFLTGKDAQYLYEECLSALIAIIAELELFIKTNQNFKNVGEKMLDIWKLSLDEKTYRKIPDEVTRNWK
jgi:serine/threonine-protein kinase HipA